MVRIEKEYVENRGEDDPTYRGYIPVVKTKKGKRLMFVSSYWNAIGFMVDDLEYGTAFCGSFTIHWADGQTMKQTKDCKTGKYVERRFKTPKYVKDLKYED